MRRFTLLFAIGILVLASMGAGRGNGPSGDRGQGSARANEHARIVEYWTAERMRNAEPREVTREDGNRSEQAKPDKPGGGNGGGGGGCKGKKGCAPTNVIDTPADGAVVSGLISIEGTASDQDGMITGVTVTAAGIPLTVDGRESWSATWDTGTVGNGSYTITSTATDDNGRTDNTSISVTVNNIEDPPPPNSAPSNDITTPTNGATVSGSISIQGTASDSDGFVDTVTVTAGGTPLNVSGTTSWSTTWDTTSVANGSYTISSTATDDDGATATDSINVTVDNVEDPPPNSAPSNTITAPSNGATVSGSVSIHGTASDSDGSISSVAVTAGGSPLSVTGTTSWSATWDTTSVTDGSYTITSTATDDDGATASDSINVTVSNDPGPQPEPVEGGDYWGGSPQGNARTSTGKVFFTDAGLNYVCSGTLVDGDLTDSTRPPIILTAGHCAYGDTGFVTNFAFFPDYESQKTSSCSQAQYGCWTADAIVTSTAWANNEDFERDAAFVRVGNGGLTNQAITDVIPASQGVGFYSSVGDYVVDFGYPAGNPYPGNRLAWCAGDTGPNTRVPSDVTQGLVCDMTGGSSGGAWLDNFNFDTELGVAVSLNSYKYVTFGIFESAEMYGPIFGSWTQNIYNKALTASGNTTG